MSKSNSKIPEPNQPPEIKRRVALHHYQWWGLPIIFIIPILGAAGLFNNHRTVMRADSQNLALRVDYHDRVRMVTVEPMSILVTNRGSSDLSKVEVKVSRELFNSEEGTQMRPEPKEIDEQFARFEIEKIPAGESRAIEVDLNAGRPGTHRGLIEASAGSDSARVSVESFSYP